MRILKTAPQNREFFNEHGASLAKYNLIGLIGQTLSGLSLAYAVFALIAQQTGGSLPPFVTASLALIVGLFVELANRVLARPAIRPFVVKDLFADSPGLVKRHKVLNRAYLIGLIGVALLSYLLSGVGSTYYAEDANGKAPQTNVDSIKQVQASLIADINSQFAADTAMTTAPFNIRLQAAVSRFQADSAAIMKERQRFTSCANRGNEYCKGKRVSLLADIDKARAALADSTATIARQKADALASLLDDRKEELSRLDNSGKEELSRARSDNQAKKAQHDSETSFQGIIFIILTVAGQTVFYFMVYLTLQVEAGSEIEYTLEPNEFWNLPSTAAEFFTGLSWRLERRTRAALLLLFSPRKERKTDLPYKSLFDTQEPTQDDNGGAHHQRTEEERKECRSRARERKPLDDENGTTQAKQRERLSGEVGAVEQCEQCGKDYTRKTTRQRFCSTNCRLDHHAKKHNGKRFDQILKTSKK